MKVHIDYDEWYPVFGVVRETKVSSTGEQVDVPDEIVGKWERVREEFLAIQDEMAEYHGFYKE